MRIAAQLIDAETDEHLWSDVYERDFADVFGIQADIAMNIANALEAEFSLEEQSSIEKVPTDSPVAYALYLRGWNAPSVDSAVEYIDRAIELDPEFALAYAAKATIYAYWLAPTEETESLIRDNAEKALALDPSIGMAHVALGTLYESQYSVAEAQRAFERAYELSPNDRDILDILAAFYRLSGDYSQAVLLGERVLELDPNNWWSHNNLGSNYKVNGDVAASAIAYQKAMTLDPAQSGPHVQIAWIEAVRGNHAEALKGLEIAEQLDSGPLRLAQMAVVYGLIDRREEAARLFNELEERALEDPVNDALWAMAYIGLGNYGEARRRLANAIDNQAPAGIFPFAAFRPAFSNLKSNAWGDPELDKPEFQELRDRIFALE